MRGLSSVSEYSVQFRLNRMHRHRSEKIESQLRSFNPQRGRSSPQLKHTRLTCEIRRDGDVVTTGQRVVDEACDTANTSLDECANSGSVEALNEGAEAHRFE